MCDTSHEFQLKACVRSWIAHEGQTELSLRYFFCRNLARFHTSIFFSVLRVINIMACNFTSPLASETYFFQLF